MIHGFIWRVDRLPRPACDAETAPILCTSFWFLPSETSSSQCPPGCACSGLLIPDTDLGENPRRERGV